MKAFYDKKPDKYEKSKNDYVYRWGFKEFQDEDTNGWICNEVRVSGTVTKDKLTRAVISACCDSDRETKYINDYNSAQNGLFDDNEEYKQLCIDRYLDFLEKRKLIKHMIDIDCEKLKIF